MSGTEDLTTERVPRRIWIGLVAVVVYILFAAGLGNAVDSWIGTSTGPLELVLSHAAIVPPIIAGVLFVRWAGWTPAVWRTPPPTGRGVRRWWWLAIPVLMLVQSLANIAAAPLDTWTIPTAALVLVVTCLVGLGEELYFRGILRASITGHHGETFAFIGTSLAFGLAHSAAGLAHGVPLSIIAFQVAVTVAAGAVFMPRSLRPGGSGCRSFSTPSTITRSCSAVVDSTCQPGRNSLHRPSSASLR